MLNDVGWYKLLRNLAHEIFVAALTLEIHIYVKSQVSETEVVLEL